MKPAWSYRDLFFAAALYFLLGQWLLAATHHWPGAPLTGQWLLTAVWLALLALRWSARGYPPLWQSTEWRWRPAWLWRSVAAGLGLMLAVEGVSRWLPDPPLDLPVRKLLDSPSTASLAAASIVLLGPLAEEFFFRGLLQPLVAASAGVATGIAAGATLFALLHAPQLGYSWPNVALIAAAGAVFGWLRHASHSTLMAAVAHATYNSVLLLIYFQQRPHG